MTLTEHQLFHLNAILKETSETKKLSKTDRDKLASCKKIKSGKVDDYYDQIEKDVDDIIKSGIFPDMKTPSSIHDYIEKDTKGGFK